MASSPLRLLTAWTNGLIVFAIGILVASGIASIKFVNEHFPAPNSANNDWIKQLLFAVLGTGVLLLLQVVDYRRIGHIAWALHLFALSAILYTLLPFVRLPFGATSKIGFVPYVNGAYCWIDFGILRFQPAELAKITYVLTLAQYLRYRDTQRSYAGLVPPFLMTLFPVIMILKQPDLGMSLVFLPVLFITLFIAGAKRRHLATIALAGLACIPIIWCMGDKSTPVLGSFPPIIKEYQRYRVLAMLPGNDAKLARFRYQQQRALTALGSGGITGIDGTTGGGTAVKVPEGHNDMVFAMVGQQWGLAGTIAVLLAYVMLFLAGIETAGSTKDPYGRLVAVGLTAMLAISTFENLLVVLRLMPVTGVTLPFISYGGSSLLANFTLAALLINIGSRRPIVFSRSKFDFIEP